LWLFRIPAVLLLGLGLALMVWLSPGPRLVAGVELDIHTMLLGSLCVLLGYQTLWLWVFAGIHGWRSGLLPANRFLRWAFEGFHLERGLVAGLVLVLVGLGCNFWLVGEWWRQHLGPLEVQTTFRGALWGFTAMVLGVQTVYGSFILGVIRMTA